MRLSLVTTLILAVAASPALAKDKPFKKQKHRGAKVSTHCPPGLAKKSPACVPPGQAKKRASYKRGDPYKGNDRILRSPNRYGLPKPSKGTRYYQVGDAVLQVNRETGLILDVLTGLARVAK